MAKGGKHALPRGSKKSQPAKKTGGAHAVSEDNTALAAVKPKRRAFRKTFTAKNVIKALLLILVCFVMISPMKSCLLTDNGYIGITAAEGIAFDDAGILPDKANNVQADVIKIDGDVYYKVQFTGSVTDYRYIIDASSGEIVARAFYHID